jgi:hypothetical protein
MKHFVHIRTISRTNAVNVKLGYPKVFIATPELFTGEQTDAND